jgi:hypothetical protein
MTKVYVFTGTSAAAGVSPAGDVTLVKRVGFDYLLG